MHGNSLYLHVYVVGSSDVGLFLNGKLYPNNSLVNREEIGEGNKALLCFTNNNTCCDHVSLRGWYSPDNMSITTTKMDGITGFYTSRGPSLVHLNKVNGTSVNVSSGIFHCKIPDADGNDRRLYMGIYCKETGGIFLFVTILKYLSCKQVIQTL